MTVSSASPSCLLWTGTPTSGHARAEAKRSMGCGASTASPPGGAKATKPDAQQGGASLAPERREKLTQIFKSMDTDGDNLVDIAEYRAATSNQTMLKLFAYMDQKGDKDGRLSLEEWLATMSTVGLSMSDEVFEKDLMSMVKPMDEMVAALAPERLASLKKVFKEMDIDGDGTVDFKEYKASTSNATLLALFTHMDESGDGNGELTLDEWLSTMAKVGNSMTDEQFEADLLSMIKPPEKE
jgi:Ca2+-binding EF-hand superfamily protein